MTFPHAVLGALGRQLTGDEHVDLAACLPTEAALFFTSQIPDLQPLTGWGFVKDLAHPHGCHPRDRPLGHRGRYRVQHQHRRQRRGSHAVAMKPSPAKINWVGVEVGRDVEAAARVPCV